MDLSIIIVNWNSVAYLRDCVDSVLAGTTGLELELIVVDNASPDGDAEVIEREFKSVKLIKSTENLGFAAANNLGFRNSCGSVLLFLNPDTQLNSRAINVMYRDLQSLPEAGILGCKLLNSDLSIQTSSIQTFPTILNQILQSEYLRLHWPKVRLWGIWPLFECGHVVRQVEAISGACMMMRREVFDQVGLFSEEYFMYSEDLDLCYKTRSAGFVNYYVGGVTIIHHAGKSSRPAWALVMKAKSDLRFCSKHRGPLYCAAFRAALICNAVGRLVAVSCARAFPGTSERSEKLAATFEKWHTILKVLAARENTMEAPIPSRIEVRPQGES